MIPTGFRGRRGGGGGEGKNGLIALLPYADLRDFSSSFEILERLLQYVLVVRTVLSFVTIHFQLNKNVNLS